MLHHASQNYLLPNMPATSLYGLDQDDQERFPPT